jgi:hypothetical protein
MDNSYTKSLACRREGRATAGLLACEPTGQGGGPGEIKGSFHQIQFFCLLSSQPKGSAPGVKKIVKAVVCLSAPTSI